MTDLHQFNVFAASRGEGLHPILRALLERTVVSPFSEVSIRHDGLVQAGPSPDSEVVPTRVNVTLFPRGFTQPISALSEPETRKPSTERSTRVRIV
jgi:hypothetical protein